MNRILRVTSIRRARVDAAGKSVRTMRRGIARLATTVLVSGGLGLAGLSLGAGTAQADGPFQWCPGQWVPDDAAWDMGVCHTWFWVDSGQGNVAPAVWDGDNPPLPPPPPDCPIRFPFFVPSRCGGL
jgi:hypothetical protein